MLRTRLIVGTLLAALAAGMILIDERFAPWYPFLFATVAVLATLGTLELLALLPEAARPNRVVVLAGVLLFICLSWCMITRVPVMHGDPFERVTPAPLLNLAFALFVLIAFLREMLVFRAPGSSVQRLALTVWTVAYLGLLPSF